MAYFSIYFIQGLSWQECLDQCPPGFAPACHNSESSVTMSRTVDDIFFYPLNSRFKLAGMSGSVSPRCCTSMS